MTGRREVDEETLDWDSLVRPNQTVVIYMGLAGLGTIFDGLLRHGLSPDTPAALVEQGTTSAQNVLTGTVGTLPSIVERKRPQAPTLVIVGEVVRLRDKLAWYRTHKGKGSAFVSPAKRAPRRGRVPGRERRGLSDGRPRSSTAITAASTRERTLSFSEDRAARAASPSRR